MSNTDKTIAVDIVSDVMCPWCYVGKRRLEKAIAARPDVKFDIRWRPFQLDPTIPPEGVDRKAYLKKKFGDNAGGAMYDNLRQAGEAEGIPFAFDDIDVSPNTLNAHRVIKWAATANVQDDVVEALFKGYFVEGANLTKKSYLGEIAEAAGMEREVVDRLLAGDADLEMVREEIALAQRMGVTGVPCFILANKLVVMGAQDSTVLIQAIDQALDLADEAAESQFSTVN